MTVSQTFFLQPTRAVTNYISTKAILNSKIFPTKQDLKKKNNGAQVWSWLILTMMDGWTSMCVMPEVWMILPYAETSYSSTMASLRLLRERTGVRSPLPNPLQNMDWMIPVTRHRYHFLTMTSTAISIA